IRGPARTALRPALPVHSQRLARRAGARVPRGALPAPWRPPALALRAGAAQPGPSGLVPHHPVQRAGATPGLVQCHGVGGECSDRAGAYDGHPHHQRPQ
ncbi:hypothetical protein HaLaN_32722, partial [Haematococcus lacustris]